MLQIQNLKMQMVNCAERTRWVIPDHIILFLFKLEVKYIQDVFNKHGRSNILRQFFVYVRDVDRMAVENRRNVYFEHWTFQILEISILTMPDFYQIFSTWSFAKVEFLLDKRLLK